MIVNLVLHVELYVSGHENNGLPHEEQEQPPDEVEYQYQGAKEEETLAEYVVYKCLFIETFEQSINLDVLGNQVKCMSYNLGGDHGKDVGNDDEEYAGDYPPFVFIEILIKKTEVLHECVKLCKWGCFF
jgi:hypothetical protein